MSTSVLGKRTANQDDGKQQKKRKEVSLMQQVIQKLLNPETSSVRSDIVVRIVPPLKRICDDGYYDHPQDTLVVYLSSVNHKPLTAVDLQDVTQTSTPLTGESPLKCVAMADWRGVHDMSAPALIEEHEIDNHILRRCLELMLDYKLELEGVNDEGWTEVIVCDSSGVLCPSPVSVPIPRTAELMQQVIRFLSSRFSCDDHIDIHIYPLHKRFMGDYAHHYGELHFQLIPKTTTSKHAHPPPKATISWYSLQNVRQPLTPTSVLQCIAIFDTRYNTTQTQIGEQVNDELLRRCLELVLDARHDDVWSDGHSDTGWSQVCVCDKRGTVCPISVV